jgi:hypothetical protein
MKKEVNLPDHGGRQRAVRDDCQVLPHAQLLRRENAFDGAKEKAIVFHLDFIMVLK